jgi:predicted transposase YdaD
LTGNVPAKSVKSRQKGRSQQDSLWKELIDQYLEKFLAFFFAVVHQDIDWSKGYEILDNELAEITQDSEIGKRQVDKLIKAYQLNGQQKLLLIHIEVQGYKDLKFAERMHIYNFLIYHKYQLEVESLAILSDKDKNFRPSSFTRGNYSRVIFSFPIVKLLDYTGRKAELEQAMNPFALVVLAHLEAQKLKDKSKPSELKDAKLRLIRLLFNKGYTREDIIKLFRFINWLMILPANLQAEFRAEVRKYSGEVYMSILDTPSDFELMLKEEALQEGIQKGLQEGIQKGLQEGIQKGLQEGIQKGLQEGTQNLTLAILEQRFGKLELEVKQQITGLNSDQLTELGKNLLSFGSIDEVKEWLQDKTKD